MTPRISLRSEYGNNGYADGQVGVGPRSPDGSPFLFEVLGAAGPESSQQAAAASSDISVDFSKKAGSTSLETCPPPALDRRRWTEAIGTDFMVRGPSYLTTRVKVPSAKQVRSYNALWRCIVFGRSRSVPRPPPSLSCHRPCVPKCWFCVPGWSLEGYGILEIE